MHARGLEISITNKNEIIVSGRFKGTPSELRAVIRVLADTASAVEAIRISRIKDKVEEKMRAAAQPNISSTNKQALQQRSAAVPRQQEVQDGEIRGG